MIDIIYRFQPLRKARFVGGSFADNTLALAYFHCYLAYYGAELLLNHTCRLHTLKHFTQKGFVDAQHAITS